MRKPNTLQADASLEEVLMLDARCTMLGGNPESRIQKRAPIANLTLRETQILRWVVDGRTNKQIAKMLSRSVRTVEYHRNRLMKKLNAHTAAQMAKQAIKAGML